MGATREEIKGIKDSINQLVKISGVKAEDMGDRIALLKRIEIKFNEMVELRKVFSFFDKDGLADQEKRIHNEAKERKGVMITQKNAEEQASREAKLQVKIEKKR